MMTSNKSMQEQNLRKIFKQMFSFEILNYLYAN